MTTSVVAIIAGTSHEASATPPCDVSVSSSGAGFTVTTNVNCISITAPQISSDVTIAPTFTVGPAVLSGPLNIEVLVDDTTLLGGVFNNGTIIGNIGSTSFASLTQIGIDISGSSTLLSGVTNGAGTGVIDIIVSNTATDLVGPVSANGIGIDITSSKFAGNVVNNGIVNVTVLADPTPTAIAEATGMGVVSFSFVGNVINTHALNVVATAIAGSNTATNASATARARGISINSGSFNSGSFTNTGAAHTSTSFGALFQGNVSNSGVINALASASALAGSSGTGVASATAVAEGILIGGEDFKANATNTGPGTMSIVLTDVFTGNITNTSTIQANATAFAARSASGSSVAEAAARAFGIRLSGDQFTGNLTSGGGSTVSGVFSTLTAAFTANISNTDLIDANAFGRATAFGGDGPVLALVDSRAVGIDVVGAVATGNVSLTSLGDITNLYNGTFTGNISNSGAVNVFATASGTAAVSLPGLAVASLTQTAGGISFIGAEFTGNVSDTGGGNITNTLNATFTGNVSNSGFIGVAGTSFGTAVTTSGTASAIVNGNADGISVIGGIFTGNVIATSIGTVTNTLSDFFTGNITNSATGIINASENAAGFASVTSTGGSAIASVHASAGGIRLIGGSFAGNTSFFSKIHENPSAFFNGNITNNGKIFAQATAFGLAGIGGTSGIANLDVRSDAHGIAVLGAVFSGIYADRIGTFTGNISNTGTITAFATAVGRVTGLAAIGSSVSVQASADGILTVLDRLNGNITNTGSINAYGTASVSLDNSIGRSTALAFADGIDVFVSTFTGNVGNTGGVIYAFATAASNDQVGIVHATANGIVIDANTFLGNVNNTGGIFVQANSNATHICSTASAVAAGISLLDNVSFVGTVTNGPGSLIMAGAIAVSDTLSNATATGIAVDARRMFGDVVNNGGISAQASATAASTTTSTATAQAAGIHVGDAGGPFMSSFIGNVTSSGLIMAFATATSPFFARASAEGIGFWNTSAGNLSAIPVISGNISNTGTISAEGVASSQDTAYAFAAGMFIAASTFTGNVTNAGLITVLAQAQVTGTALSASPTATADAAGIAVLGGTNATSFTFQVTGNVTNASTGVISSQAFANANLTGGEAHAHSAGIELASGAFNDKSPDAALIGISTFLGNVANSGVITSVATSNATFDAESASFGIESLTSTFIGNISNAGTVNASAVSVVTNGFAFANAVGMNIGGFETNFSVRDGISFAGNIVNSGSIGATAIISGGTSAFGDAYGIFLGAEGAHGTIANAGTGRITADAFVTITTSATTIGAADGTAVGIGFDASTFTGSVSNAGTIVASMTASLTGPGRAEAAAYGIWGANTTFLGNISNTGFIEAIASSSNLAAAGTAIADSDVAGIRLTGSFGVGTIANTGTLVHVSTFSGNVKNAGTIMAIGNASAQTVGVGTTAFAFDPATGIRIEVSTFAGLVTSSGLIVAQATASANGGAGSVASALAAGIGINNAGLIGDGTLFPNFTYIGTIANTGTIMADAKAFLTQPGGGALVAGATGIRAYARTVIGDINNSGLIQATATGTANIQAFGSAFSRVFAAGVHVGGVTNALGNFAEISTFIGNVANTGTILAFATSNNAENAFAAGIQIDTFSGMTGNVTNSSKGLIQAVAVANASNDAFGTAAGVFLHGFSFIGNISNDGTIIAQSVSGSLVTPSAGGSAFGITDRMSTFIGNIANTGHISASASAFASADASAFATGVSVGSLSSFLGNVSNTGTITAFSTAMVNSGFGTQDVRAAGVIVDSSVVIGNILNTAPGIISATALAPTIGSNARGGATGVGVFISTFIGNISNTGTVMALGTGPNVHAFGVFAGGSTFAGNINNNGAGVISAKSSAFAVGIYSEVNTFLGNINNNALIIASGDATGILSVTPTFLGAMPP